MPINKDNLTAAVSLLAALAQRHDTLHQLSTQLASPIIWRSIDGSLSIPIPPPEVAQLEAFMKAYLDEAQVVQAALRALLAET